MTTVKNQHFVPQFYLRQFANSQSQVNVFDKLQQKTFRANIADVGSARYFYDLSQEQVASFEAQIEKKKENGELDPAIEDEVRARMTNVQWVEQKLSTWEHRFANVLNDVIMTLEKRRRFKKRFRSNIAQLVALQYWRTYERRQGMMEFDRKLETEVMKLVNRMNEVKQTNFTAEDLGIAYDPDRTADRHKMIMLDTEILNETANIFNSHIWVIGVNDTKVPLYTSDNPVTQRAHKTDDWRSNTGIASPGIEIFFPLSPKYVLKMFERSYFHTMESYDGRLIYLKEENIVYNNSHQVQSAYRQIYSPTSDFQLIEQMLAEEPEIAEPKTRFNVG
ncbi:MAG: DUF4238 domain-containing protein [Anaerolineaceae bacterium]|nr:DUF4238 domain-containing protein [Anaerolineaceae bacterium]